MGWFDWARRGGAADSGSAAWRQAWAEAVKAPDAAQADVLRAQLRNWGVADDRYEIEREMLDGLDALVELSARLAAAGPEPIVTGHRAIGADRCYFSAPASVPDDPAQPTGTLLLTNTRAIFVGGARAVTIPWHTVGESLPQGRDLILIRGDKQHLYRFRCNSFTDALRAALLARHVFRRRV